MTTITIDVQKTDQKLKELLTQIASGKEVVFKYGGQLVARLIPAGKRIAGLHAGTAKISPDFDEPLGDAFWSGGK
jgi:antitoxin (DNA-binding transcriptional repressor) of toxin-antitoxin stability system